MLNVCYAIGKSLTESPISRAVSVAMYWEGSIRFLGPNEGGGREEAANQQAPLQLQNRLAQLSSFQPPCLALELDVMTSRGIGCYDFCAGTSHRSDRDRDMFHYVGWLMRIEWAVIWQ